MKNSKKQTKKWTRKTKDKRNKKTQKKKNKTKRKKRERERVRKKVILATHLISSNGFFSHVVYLFLHQCLLSTIRLHYWIHVICWCYFFVKAIVFFELFKRISFSILLTFRISAMKLFRFMNFFSLDI